MPREEPSPYSRLNDSDQAALSVLLETAAIGADREIGDQVRATLGAVPERLRDAYFSQVLPQLVRSHRTRTGLPPTRAELLKEHPDLRREILSAYPWLPDELRLPVEIGGLQVLSTLGVGGQAVVLRCRDELHSVVAVKLSTSPQHNARVERERDLLALCEHESVVPVIGSGEHEGRVYFVMPQLVGATAAERWRRAQPSVEEALQIAERLAGAVARLHDQGVLHRDIKPDNLWIDQAGQVKLLDLGMAIEQFRIDGVRTAVGEHHGTPACMSPEQAAEDATLDGVTSDVFAIGAVLFWLLSGELPFAAPSARASVEAAAAYRLNTAGLGRLRSLPPSVQEVCLQALARRPEQRPASARELQQRLAEVRERLWSLARRRQRHRRLMVAGGVAVVAFAALFGMHELGRGAAASGAERLAELDPCAWVGEVAEQQGVELPRVSANELDVRVLSPLRAEQFGVAGSVDPASSGLLYVRPAARLVALGDALQFRIGATRWLPLPRAKGHDAWVAVLPRNAARGPIEVRLGSGRNGTEPITYAIDHHASADADTRAIIQQRVEDATSHAWLSYGAQGWEVAPGLVAQYSDVIRAIAVEGEAGDWREAPVAAMGTRGEAAINDHIRQSLGRRCDASSVRVKLSFVTGQETLPTWARRRNAHGVDETSESARRVLAAIGDANPAARFWEGRLVLTGLARADLALESVSIGRNAGDLSMTLPVRQAATGDGVHRGKSIEGEPIEREHVQRLLVPSPNDRREQFPAVVELVDGRATRPVSAPPFWREVFLRGRLKDGSLTPVYRVINEKPAHAAHAPRTGVSPGGVPADAYLYAYRPTEPAGGGPRPMMEWKPDTWLHVVLPPGATRVEYFHDAHFKRPVKTLVAGEVCARFLDRDGRLLGACAYRIDAAVLRRLTEAAKTPLVVLPQSPTMVALTPVSRQPAG